MMKSKYTYSIGFRQIAMFCFFAGAILGVLAGVAGRSAYLTEFSVFQKSLTEHMAGYSFDNLSVMRLALIRNSKILLLILFFTFTSFYTPFLLIFLILCGTYFGFLSSAHILACGFDGLARLLACFFPHYLILFPVFFLLLQSGYEVSHPEFGTAKRQVVMSHLPRFFLLCCLLVLASFLEGYVNIPFLKMLL